MEVDSWFWKENEKFCSVHRKKRSNRDFTFAFIITVQETLVMEKLSWSDVFDWIRIKLIVNKRRRVTTGVNWGNTAAENFKKISIPKIVEMKPHFEGFIHANSEQILFSESWEFSTPATTIGCEFFQALGEFFSFQFSDNVKLKFIHGCKRRGFFDWSFQQLKTRKLCLEKLKIERISSWEGNDWMRLLGAEK